MGEFGEGIKARLRRWQRDATKWLTAAGDVLSSLHRARFGGPVSRGLAVASTAGTVMRLVFPDESPHDQLVGKGYKLLDDGLGAFFCDRLMHSDLPRKAVQVDGAGEDDGGQRFVFWDAPDAETGVDVPRGVAAVYERERWVEGPFVRGGRIELLSASVQKAVWGSRDLMLAVASRSHVSRDAPSNPFELLPMEPPGTYIGEPGVEWFAERLARHHGETRSMLLVGPTGAGKSTLGRLIAGRAVEDGRTLKIASQALKLCSAADILELVIVLGPSVLLLDDVTMIETHRGDTNEQMLELMEALHGKAKLVIATLMTEDVPLSYRDGTEVEGSLYYSGMRPGRVDEVVRVKRPAPRTRKAILLHYFGGKDAAKAAGVTRSILNDIIERTAGLTGAYLREVVHRIKVHGIEKYKSEVASIRAAAPRVGMRHARRLGLLDALKPKLARSRRKKARWRAQKARAPRRRRS